MTRQRFLIWQALLVSCIIRFAQSSVITVNKDSEQEICTDFICTRHSLKTETRTFVDDVNNDGGHQVECKNCAHCTDSGYSVCLRAKNTDDKCLCAQEIPRGCNVLPRAGFKPVPEQQQMNICYLSSLRNPPKPVVLAESNSDLIVTIDQFRSKTYWKNMKMHNLTLYYEFPAQSPHFCDGTLTTVKRNSDGASYVCTASLKIEQEEEPIDSEENLDGSIPQDDYESDLMPEIQFERSVFDGAPHVRFYYRFQVERERQLNAQHNLVRKLTTLTSDLLVYDLNPSVKQVTSQTQDDKPQPKGENAKASDKAHKSSFLDEHLNNGGQLQLIVCVSIITLGVCLILIAATFLYRRHIGNSDKRPKSKHMNGFEYKSTVQDERP